MSSVFMLIAICIVLSFQSFWAFAIMSLVWAFYYSFQSGTVNAYVYDLLKEQGEQSQYRKAISRHGTYQLAALLLSSLGASVIVKFGNLLTPYWIALIPTVIAIVLMSRMHEPPMERTEQSSGTALNHVRSAYKNIVKKNWLWLIFLALAFMTGARFIWYEYYQVYALGQRVAPVLFGIMLALIHVGNILGSEFAHRTKSPHKVMLLSFATLVLSGLGLLLTNSSVAIIILLIACFFGSQASSIVLDENLQHETQSELRATTLSLAGLISRVIFGLGSVFIILFNATPSIIAIVSLVTFLGVLIYYPARKHLVVSGS